MYIVQVVQKLQSFQSECHRRPFFVQRQTILTSFFHYNLGQLCKWTLLNLSPFLLHLLMMCALGGSRAVVWPRDCTVLLHFCMPESGEWQRVEMSDQKTDIPLSPFVGSPQSCLLRYLKCFEERILVDCPAWDSTVAILFPVLLK